MIWVVSSAVEHCLHTAGVTGSIPVPPTKFARTALKKALRQMPRAFFFCCLTSSRALGARAVQSENASRPQQELVWRNTGRRSKDAETSGEPSSEGKITPRKVGHSTSGHHRPQHQSFCLRIGLLHAALPKEPPHFAAAPGLCGKRGITIDALPFLSANVFAFNLPAARWQNSQSRSCAALRRRARRRVRRGAGAGHNLALHPRLAPTRLSRKRPRPRMSVQ